MKVERFIIIAWAILLSALLFRLSLMRLTVEISGPSASQSGFVAFLDAFLEIGSTGYYALLALVAFFAGFIIVDFERTIIGSLLSIAMAILTTFFLLSLAVPMGILPHPGLSDIVFIQSIRLIFPVVFPVVIILNGAAALIGSVIGERFQRRIDGINSEKSKASIEAW